MAGAGGRAERKIRGHTARRWQAGTLDNSASALDEVRAERKLGQIIKKMPKAKDASAKGHKRNGKGGKVTRSSETTASKTLAELGVSKDLSARAQRMAKMDPAAFDDP